MAPRRSSGPLKVPSVKRQCRKNQSSSETKCCDIRHDTRPGLAIRRIPRRPPNTATGQRHGPSARWNGKPRDGREHTANSDGCAMETDCARRCNSEFQKFAATWRCHCRGNSGCVGGRTVVGVWSSTTLPPFTWSHANARASTDITPEGSYGAWAVARSGARERPPRRRARCSPAATPDAPPGEAQPCADGATRPIIAPPVACV